MTRWKITCDLYVGVSFWGVNQWYVTGCLSDCVWSSWTSETEYDVITVVHHHPLSACSALPRPAHCLPNPLQPRSQVQSLRERETPRSKGRSYRWRRSVLWIYSQVCCCFASTFCQHFDCNYYCVLWLKQMSYFINYVSLSASFWPFLRYCW